MSLHRSFKTNLFTRTNTRQTLGQSLAAPRKAANRGLRMARLKSEAAALKIPAHQVVSAKMLRDQALAAEKRKEAISIAAQYRVSRDNYW